MKNLKPKFIAFTLFFLPLITFSQTWTKEEQEFLDYFKNGWKLMSNKPSTYENWKATTHPDEKLTWWWTDEGMPKDLEATRNWLLDFEKEGQILHNIHVRPIRINIIDNVAMIWFYGYARISNKAGNEFDVEDKRLEVFKRDGSGWKFLGGMVDPVDVKN